MKKIRTVGMLLIALILSISVVVFASGKDTTELDRSDMVATNAEKREITNVKISLNGTPLDIPTSYGYPFIDNQSRTIIPLRIISERLGHKVEWDNTTQTAIIDGEISIKIGEKAVKTPNGDVKMDTVAILKDSRTYVPLRFVVEALGYEVSYNGPNRANNYQHMVDISGEVKGPVDPIDGEPVKEGNVYKIKTENGVVEVDLDEDINMYGRLADEQAKDLLEGFQKSMILSETANSVKVKFYLPEMPKEAGLQYNATIDLIMKEGNGYGGIMNIYGTNGPNPFTTDLGNGYYEVNFNIDMSLVENIEFYGKVSYKGTVSNEFKANLRTGKTAFGPNEYLY